jgi:hypothetical protein
LVDALRAPSKRAETTNIVAVDEHGQRLRDHRPSLGPGFRTVGTGLRRTPQFDVGRRETGQRLVHPGTRWAR